MHDSDIQQWVLSHNSDYGAVRSRLEVCRNVLLRGRLDAAAAMLERSYMNAVLSIRTDKERHERAFTAHYAGGKSRKEAALMTVYGGNKKWWIADTFDAVDWSDLALAVRAHMRNDRHAELLDAVVDNLKGVSYRKASFMLAMVGCYEFMCVDSNVGRYAGIGQETEFTNADEYMAACDDIARSVGLPLPPFVAQWAIYDMERGEHARHMPFYREVLPNL
jgi:hypothetical protein